MHEHSDPIVRPDDVEGHTDSQVPAAPEPASIASDGEDTGTDDTDGHKFMSDREIKHDIAPLARR